MRVILIGEAHLLELDPAFLLHVLQVIKEKNLKCRLALEVPSVEEIEKVLCPMEFAENRKKLIDDSLQLYPFFAADLAIGEENWDVREEIIANQILEENALHSPGCYSYVSGGGTYSWS